MIVPDQIHINCVREALWQRPDGCASVMVGAGFSHNATKARPDAREFPLWQEIAAALCARLYPIGDGERLERARAEGSGTSGFIRLAQEFVVAFGRSALHRLIQELVPDNDYVPGAVHTRLLRLPWRHVFTTNWDTLLERTRSFVADRAYSVVRNLSEIPSASNPRIFKLHGSFPSHVPFIFTEEDYRTYPKRFAPFINTVQQAMMETVFLLIGFSGDDPNFLHWSGWVRDNLREFKPKIYLAGWLDLSINRRRMLEDRNVIPIDLANHPQATSWAENLRHRFAVEWILHTLECGRPYEISQWPILQNWQSPPVPEQLQPVETVTVNAPLEEPSLSGRSNEPADLSAKVRKVVRIWEHNRNCYPGWLFIPPSKQSLIRNRTNDWEQAILQVVPMMPLLNRLSVIRELIWRKENLLEPLSEETELVAQDVLDSINCEKREIDGTKDTSARWADIREAWRNLQLPLLTAARQRFDLGEFERRASALRPFLNDHPDVSQRIHHEKCLWALQNIDFAALEKALNEWRPDACNPAWMVRKAAILLEIDQKDEAERIVNHCMAIVRDMPHNSHSLAGPSIEGWTLWLALAFERGFPRSADKPFEGPQPFRRWEQLYALKCDAWAHKRDILNALRGDAEKKDGPLFDLGARHGKTILFGNGEHNRWIVARQAVRLCEVAGLPPSASHMVVASDILSLAVDCLRTTDYKLASRLVLRIATSEDDPTFNRVWERFRIAAMTDDEVDTLVGLVTNMIAYALPKATSADTFFSFWATKLSIAFEALSRLVLRLTPNRAEDIFKRGLKYYRMEGVAKNRFLCRAAGRLMARSWEALPKTHRSRLVFDILRAPIGGLDGFGIDDRVYTDPGGLLLDDDETSAPARTPETAERWNEIIQLIVRGLNTKGEARKRAASRLVPLALWDRLTEPEAALIAQALWHTDYTGSNALPSETSLRDWVFLLLPEPALCLAEQRFRKKWLSDEPKLDGNKSLNDPFWNIGGAIAGLRHHQKKLILTTEERNFLSALVQEWTKLPIPSNSDSLIENGIHEAVIGLQYILSEIELSAAVAESLFAKAIALNQTHKAGFRLYAGIVKMIPDRMDEIAMSMRIALSSDNTAVAEEAVVGLHTWIEAATEELYKTPPPPNDLLLEIGLAIATRRRGVLNRALQLARWIFSKGSTTQRDLIAKSTLHGLRYLMEELRYDRHQSKDGAIVDVPLLRWGCAHLSLAMSLSGYGADPAVAGWAKIARNDPLPEVRHAECSTKERAIR